MFGLQLRFFNMGATQKFMLTIMETLQADPHRCTAGKVYIHGRWVDPMSGKQNICGAYNSRRHPHHRAESDVPEILASCLLHVCSTSKS